MCAVEKAVLEGLKKGIQQELAAYLFYKKGLGFVKDEELRDMLTKLASDEKDHSRILEGQYDCLVRSEMWNTYNDILKKEGLPDIDENMAEIHNELIDELSEATTPLRVLEIALILEKQARDFYAVLAEKVKDPKGKDTYIFLSKFEQGHINKIERLMGGYK